MTGLGAVILAAGKGTRMKSDLPKVAHPVGGAPMVRWVVEACCEVGCSRVVLVVGHRRADVEAIFEGSSSQECRIEFAEQNPQLGTAHAVQCAQPLLEEFRGDLLILCGDGPLIRTETLEKLIDRHRSTGADMTMATAVLEDPTGYGRIVRDSGGAFRGIVEQKNASPEQLLIREVNPSYYCVRAPALFEALPRIERNEISGEHYLTDLPALLLEEGGIVEVIDAVPAEDALSINTPEQLARADAVLRERLAAARTSA